MSLYIIIYLIWPRLRSHNQYDSKSAMFPKSGYKVKSHCIYKNSSRSIYSSFLVSKSIVKFFIDFRANFFLYHSFYCTHILFIFCTVHKPLISFYYLGVKEVKRKAIVILNTVQWDADYIYLLYRKTTLHLYHLLPSIIPET